jgi:DNA-binding CsgD family transcriptional regulator/Tfp pilus assembly protein PilO
LNNTLFKLKSGISVGTYDGIFRYNETSDTFEPDIQLNRLFPGIKRIEYLAQDSSNNIWYYNNQQPGVLRFQEDGTYSNITAPFVEFSGMVIPAFGHINALKPGSVIIGLEGGFGQYVSTQLKEYDFLPVLYISKLQSADITEGTYRFNSKSLQQEVVPRFRYSNNTINIDFAASQFAVREVSFQLKLDGFDKEWTAWSPRNSKEYTNLPAGEYTFQLKAKTVQGRVTPVLNYKFIIIPPWYQTVYARIICFLVFILLLWLGYRFFLKSMEKSRLKEKETQKDLYRQREQKMKEEALMTEKEIVSLRNEKLNLDLIHKQKELANSTMQIIQKNEFLQKLNNELIEIRRALTDEQLKNDLNATLKRIGKEIDNEKQWQVFNTHVEQVYEDLFKKLKTNYPDLTPRELSLCAYLRMNISSKEIATLMNISARGVEISRYRIRKKLRLDREANLTEFMMNL